MSESPRPHRFGRRARTAALIFAASLAFLAYARMLFWHASFAVGGSDSSGYANTARLMTAGRAVAEVEGLEQLDLPESFLRAFIPLGFVEGPSPRTMAPFYPPGFPLHIAFAALVAGWNYGPFLVSPFAALLSLLLIYLVARELGLSRLFSVAGAVVLALCPTFVSYAEQPMSDLTAAMWALATVFFALKARRRVPWAAAAGAAFAMAVLVRPTNLLLVFPIALALPLRPRTVLLFLSGGLPFAAGLLVWNGAAYGSPFRTGYSLEGGLRLSAFGEHFRHYGGWLMVLLSPLVPAGWLLVSGDRRVAARDRTLLVLWFAVLFLFYCFWDVDGAWWYTRYLLPGIPALILAALLVARDGLSVTKGGRGALLRRGLAAAALVIALVFEQRGIRKFDVLRVGEGESVYPEACRWAERKVPSGSFVVSLGMSGALRFYTSLLPVRPDWLGADTGTVVRQRARSRGRGLYALVFPDEIAMLTERLPGEWTKVGESGRVSLWRAD